MLMIQSIKKTFDSTASTQSKRQKSLRPVMEDKNQYKHGLVF